MNLLRSTFAPLVAGVIAATLATAPAARAQLGEDPQSLNAEATNHMKAGNWEAALQALTTCTDRFDRNAMTLFGPQFGVTWYRRGISEMKLKRFDDAMKSFETCYRNYPNNSEQSAGSGNIFNKRALLRWGEAAQGAEDYELAIEKYKQFIAERDKGNDPYERGAYYINLAISHLKTGNIAEGVQNLETAIKNKVEFQTPDSGIVAAFQALVEGVIETRDEKALLAFIDTNRAEIVIEPADMQAYTPLFLSLAGKAYNAEMERAAFALYQLVPDTGVMLDDVKAKVNLLGGRAGIKDGSHVVILSQLEEARKALEERRNSGDPHEVVQLGATAFLHEKHGNTRGAYAAYRQLEQFHPKSKRRENNLYNLVRTSSVIGEVAATEEFGLLFLKTFPDSEHAPTVERLMLSSLFYGGKYETCIEVASSLLPKLESDAPNEQHDICLHVLGGSYYYTGRYESARELLDRHVEMYPESPYAVAAQYFQASNESRLQYWAKAARLLDAFLEKYPDPEKNVYLPFALFDRANCHYAQDELDAALSVLTRLETEFPQADIMDMAYNLKGNVLQNQGKREQAEEYYLNALALAERRGNRVVAGESLYYLVAMLGEKPKRKDDAGRLADAVPYADRFWKDYGDDSPYKAQVAVSQVFALGQEGRAEEALNRLQDVISEKAKTPGAVGLEEAIGSFTEIYLETHSVEELKELYYNFPGVRSSDRPARALLRIALIGVFEDQVRKAGEDQQKRINAEAGIKVLFNDLKNDFDLKDLSNFILVRVGDFIRNTNSPREALPYYDEVLGRSDKSYMFPALFGRAAVFAAGSEAEQQKAIADFQRVLDDSQDRADRDNALYQMITTQLATGDHRAAIDNAKRYLDRKEGFSSRKPEVSMMLAEAFDRAGMVNDAIASYLACWNGYKGALRISAPAMQRYMELLWERNQPGEEVSDRQGAYNAGRAFLDQTRRILDKATSDEQEQWKAVERLVEQFAADPGVKSLEQQKAEASK